MPNPILESLAIVEDLFLLAEAKKHNPFRRWKKLGRASGEKKRDGADETKDWDCHKVGPYTQLCIGIGAHNEGRKKIVKVKPVWKHNYNIKYKEGLSRKKHGKDADVKAFRSDNRIPGDI